MASVTTEPDALVARLEGWRTFRVAMPGDKPKHEREAVCPASAEAGKKLTCELCLACHGTAKGVKGSIVIQAHGGFAVMSAINGGA
jgi:cytochrome c